MPEDHFSKYQTVPIPDEILDNAYKELKTCSEKLVLTMIARLTIGYRKLWDIIGNAQFQEKLGLAYSTVSKALNSLEQHGWIISVTICTNCFTAIPLCQPCPACRHGEWPSKAYKLNMPDEVVEKINLTLFKGSMNFILPYAQVYYKNHITLLPEVVQKSYTPETSDLETIVLETADVPQKEEKSYGLTTFMRYEHYGWETAIRLWRSQCQDIMVESDLLAWWKRKGYVDLIRDYELRNYKPEPRVRYISEARA